MDATHLTLLQRLNSGDEKTWKDFYVIYKPLLFKWLRFYTPTQSDAEDLSQEIMLFVSQHIHEFEHNHRVGAFRKWLRACTANIARNYLRRNQRGEKAEWLKLSMIIEELEQPSARVSLAFERDCREALMVYVLKNMESNLEAKTLELFRLHALEGLSVSEVAKRCNVSQASVYTAKSRVMRRLREEFADWLAEDIL